MARYSKLTTLFAVFCLFAAAGCSSKLAKKPPTTTVVGSETGEAVAPAQETGVSEVNIRGTEFGSIPDLQNVYFDYDRYALTENARTVLAKNAEFLKKNPDFDVLLEGHCDERGTIEYNLALGQKRAQVVRDYYMRLGTPSKALGTISYGKEKPACTESNEDCWAKNRRSETKVRSRTVSNHVPETPILAH